MRLALAQTHIVWNDPRGNLETTGRMVREAAELGCDFVVFPEMFNTGFSLLDGALAEAAYREGIEVLAESAAARRLTVAASMPRPLDGHDRPRNSLFVYGPDGCLGEYSKIHLISFLGEDQVYERGGQTLTVEIAGFRVSFFICYDLRFPDVFSRLAPGTDLYVVVANWPATRHGHWETLLKARAIENQAFVAGVNRVGSGGGLEFAGGSQVISPLGEVLARAGESEQLLTVDLDIEAVRSWRREFPCLADRLDPIPGR